jgi:hypothetical protein
MSDNEKKAIRPEAQAFSDALMMTRYAALWLKECALESSTKMLELQNAIMAEKGSKMMAMDTGEIEAMLFRLAAAHGEVKHAHKLANDIGRRLNEPMPDAPKYSPEYQELVGKSVSVKLSSVARR